MYNLLVMGLGWPEHESTFTVSRILEYTDDAVAAAHRRDGQIDYDKLMRYPCLFMPEIGADEEIARVGHITRVTPHGRGEVLIEYVFDQQVPPIDLGALDRVKRDLQIADFEFTRTHWAVKRIDLFRVMVRSLPPRRNRPTLFQINEPPQIDDNQMSAMMPFSPAFAEVYRSIQSVGAAVGMQVNRADDIWIDHAIIQDIVRLIDRSRIIIADCSGKNPNVFYEAGIAHALGREVILIAQHLDDIPFDLRHLRAVTYHNNGEGRADLQSRLEARVRTILGLPPVPRA